MTRSTVSSPSSAAGPRTASRSSALQGLARRLSPRPSPSALPPGWSPMFSPVRASLRRMKDVIKQVEAADGKVILFIDEMHMLLGAGRSRRSAMDAANMLKPALARGRIRCVGATTFDEYRKYIEKDAALKRRFQKVQVEEPSMDTTIEILQALKKRHEHHHGLEIQDAALVAAAQLAGRYITGRQFPDKAIDLIDEACATASKKMRQINRKKAEVNTTKSSSAKAMKEAIIIPDDVGQVVSRWTGIPVTALNQEEKDKLICLADRLHQRVVGQDEAVNLVADAVLRSRVGLDHPGQPIGSFLFLGSTGVGKTELAKALAEQLFDSEKMLVRFDMSEYVGSSSVLRLVGAPPRWWTTD
uniref:AAA+ ATPase domain-containing protein n=1 Tax=Aegilops tauschii subsp. strangulata TaxID=200361 RepID=A0A453H7H3_AEGTS